MKIIFKNISEITKKEIIKFNYFNLWKNKLLMFILLYMPVVWSISGVGMYIRDNDTRRLALSTVLSIAWLALIFIPPYTSVKRKYKTEDYSNEYTFYEDKFSAENKFTKEEIFYANIYKVYETKNFFYFYVDKRNGLIVNKNSFSAEEKDSFSIFLRNKLNKKYKEKFIINLDFFNKKS